MVAHLSSSMNSKLVLILISCGLLLANLTCTRTNPVGPAPTRNNLLTNQWFEQDGKPSVAGWQVLDAAYAKVVTDSVPMGGSYALWLAPAWCVPDPCFAGGIAIARIHGLNDSADYNLSFYEKNTSSTHGQIGVSVIGPDTSYALSISPLNDGPNWSWRAISFWVKVDSTDTLFIQLGSAPLPQSTNATGTGVYYADVVLTKVAP
jgi:hypothetical protein